MKGELKRIEQQTVDAGLMPTDDQARLSRIRSRGLDGGRQTIAFLVVLRKRMRTCLTSPELRSFQIHKLIAATFSYSGICVDD